MNDTRILDCGHTPSAHSEHTTGTAHTRDEKEICWTCAALMEIGEMCKAGKATLYWSKYASPVGWRVSNWPGFLMFEHIRVTSGQHNIGRTRDDVWFVGPDGYIWHGVQIGEWNQILHAKRTKQRTDLPFRALADVQS